ncbi:probable G-protein coupled receptor [Lytechinus variegatus]|uniref:probable G-protein coupled receptor n=1 Tax=Lytechinus variegatus TaxID=7654 RepID=UPI001BB19968|nr:probable G-protein coupled receptor [Lytechinus variegatus]
MASNVSDSDMGSFPSVLLIFELLIMSIINLAAIIANTLVLVILIKTPALHTLTHLFVGNLCTLDLLCSITVIPFSIASYAMGEWHLGQVYCEINGFSNTFFAIASILTLSVISVERYYSIAHPMSYATKMTMNKTILLIIYIWVQSAVLSVPPLIGLNSYNFNANRGHCTFVWEKSVRHIIYVVMLALLCFIIPGLIVIVTYINVFQIAREAARQVCPAPSVENYGSTTRRDVASVSQTRGGGSKSDDKGDVTPTSPGKNCFSVKRLRRKSKHSESSQSGDLKAAKTILLIVGAFFLLWTPFFVLHMFGVIHGVFRHQDSWERITTWFAYSSSVVNPFLYGMLNRHIREELSRIWEVCSNFILRKKPQDEDDFPGGAEDFFQFLERTTTTTTTGSSRTTGAKIAELEAHRIPGQIDEISEG